MPEDLGNQFEQRLDRAFAALARVGQEQAELPARPEGWRRKEILGHLLDSAANNHVRFSVAATAGSYTGPSYDQRGWVRLHGYAELPWSELLGHWRRENAMLARVVRAIPDSALGARCLLVGATRPAGPVDLRFLILDYLEHLEHHVRQIAGE